MDTITKESNPKLWERLKKVWELDKMRRTTVIGPGGVAYKVFRPDDDTILFKAMTGLDGTYAQRSTGGIAP